MLSEVQCPLPRRRLADWLQAARTKPTSSQLVRTFTHMQWPGRVAIRVWVPFALASPGHFACAWETLYDKTNKGGEAVEAVIALLLAIGAWTPYAAPRQYQKGESAMQASMPHAVQKRC